ncbi:MAG: NADH-quinone oxidoreductase subunit J family protein [Acidimicrobiales bacterium]
MNGIVPAVLLAVTHASRMDIGVFVVAAAVVLSGAVGVVVARNPVHAALMLVMTLFGVAVLFVLQRADFLAAVQVIVYAGAIVVLFLFVIMFLGVDREENLAYEPLRGQRPLAVGLVALAATGLLLLAEVARWTTGAPQVAGSASGPGSNVAKLGRSVFTTYLFPFEVTSALLVIAVVGAVVLARRPAAIPPAAAQLAPADDVLSGSPGAAPEPSGSEAAGGADVPGGIEAAGGADVPGGAGAVTGASGDGAPVVPAEEVAP